MVGVTFLAGLLTGALWTGDPVLAQSANPGISFRCTVTVSTQVTIQSMPAACLSQGPQVAIYITDILFASNAGAIAADSFDTLKYGTGTACGTGTTVFWGAMATAATQNTVIQNLKTPIRIPPENDICWINSTAGSKFINITGYYAP